MKRICIGIAIATSIFCSCSNRTKGDGAQIDSSLYLTNNIQLGDSVINLVGKGILTPDASTDEFFNLTDKTLGGVPFEIARATSKDGLINGLSYIGSSTNEADSFQVVVEKMFPNLCSKYGKPVKDSTYMEKDELAKHYSHEYEWRTPNKIVCVVIQKTKWFVLGGGNTYSMIASVDIQDSVVIKHNLTNVFYEWPHK